MKGLGGNEPPLCNLLSCCQVQAVVVKVICDAQKFIKNCGSHTKDVKNGSGPCLHGTQDELGTMKHNWLARCQYVTGWVSMWAYDMLSQ